MEFGGKQVPSEPDLVNLRLRWQAAAAEAVDPDGSAGTGQLLEKPRQLVGIVRQVLDLLRPQHRSEPVAARIGPRLAGVAAHGDLLPVRGEAEFHHEVLAAAVEPHAPEVARLESTGFDAHVVGLSRSGHGRAPVRDRP